MRPPAEAAANAGKKFGRMTDKVILSLSPSDLASMSKPDFRRFLVGFGRVEGRIYRRENWPRRDSSLYPANEKKPLPNE